MTCWDLVDKEGDQIDDIIRLGLEDASMKGRELARETFIKFRDIFPAKAERLKASLSSSVLARVVKAESKYENKKRIQDALQLQKEEELRAVALQLPSPVTRSASDEDLDNIMSKSTPSGLQPEGGQDNAVTSIQALIRGNMARRFSNRFSILEEHPGNSSSEYVDDNMEPIIVHPSRENKEYHDIDNIDVPLYLQQPSASTTVETHSHSPHTSTWMGADHLSPLSMDIGHGRNSHENGHSSPPQRKTLSPTKSPPAPGATKVKSASLR